MMMKNIVIAMNELLYGKIRYGVVLLSCIIFMGEKAVAAQELSSSLSTPEECARACRDGEPPKMCYYHFNLELYNTMGGACDLCTPNSTIGLRNDCQCVLADGIERGILTANRMVPGPSIQVCEGDRVIVDVENHMHGHETSIHWHGVFQKGSQYYDGVPRVTQCPIPESTTFRYQWPANNEGTHFWHAHAGLQKMDGLYGSVIVRQSPSKDVHSSLYDEDLPEHVVLISDWLHNDSSQVFPGLLVAKQGQDADNVLINGKGRFTHPDSGVTTDTPLEVFTISSGRRYRFRLINSFATVCPAEITFENHPLSVIAADGKAVRPTRANTIVTFSGERFDFIINASQPVGAYWIQLRGLGECSSNNVQNLAILRYENGPDEPQSAAPTYENRLTKGVTLNPVDGSCYNADEGSICVPQLKSAEAVDAGLLEERVDVRIYLPYRFHFYEPEELWGTPNKYPTYLVPPAGIQLTSLIDEISFAFPPSPPLSQRDDIDPEQFCNRENRPSNCGTPCSCTHQYEIPLDATVEIIYMDIDGQPHLAHPFHLHGYAFNVLGMGQLPETNNTLTLDNFIKMDRNGLLHRNFDSPPAKDTLTVPKDGYTIIRFRADNPGYWLFHCHFNFHLAIGMSVLLHVGTQNDVPPIPPNFPTCGNHLPPIMRG